MAHPTAATRPGVPRVAIACQGGGSHAAFAAGALRRLLGPEFRDRFTPVALSGTSGGAMCAALAWAGLLRPESGDPGQRLSGFWSDLAIRDLPDEIANAWALWLARLPVTVEVSPYCYAPAAAGLLRDLLRRHLALEELPLALRDREPRLLVGATDILAGRRAVFEGDTLGYDDLLASAALPPLFRAVHAHGTLFWDGLFTSNPPLREFTELEAPPDEIWVIQIDPQRRTTEPRSIDAITDRRNELAGNLSLEQELFFVDKVNELLRHYPALGERYRPITLRVVQLGVRGLDYASKFDRSADLIERLLRDGEARASWFFEDRSLWIRPARLSDRPGRPGQDGAGGGKPA